jgi:hypothetical protein
MSRRLIGPVSYTNHKIQKMKKNKEIQISRTILFVERKEKPITVAARSRHEPSSPARALELWVRIPIEEWTSLCVYFCSVLYRGIGIAIWLIPYPRSPTDCVYD